MDWGRLAAALVLLVGAGALGRVLAEALAFLGLGRCLVIDPKPYKEQSVASQCEPHEVGRAKAVVTAERLRALGVDATPFVGDVADVEPGWAEPGALIVAACDNRAGDVGANRLAAMMRARLVKVNVEPLYLLGSVRCYDLGSERPALCAECQMTDEQYRDQVHPQSCDGAAAGRPTGSPRALSQAVAGAAALAVAQLVCSPGRLAEPWYGRQWAINLLRGEASWSVLSPNPDCRWPHGRHWERLTWLNAGPARVTLGDLFAAAAVRPEAARLRLSARAAVQAICGRCGETARLLRWLARLDQAAGVCRCGGTLTAPPFWTFSELPAGAVRAYRDRPLADWGVPPRAVLAVESADGRGQSFTVGTGFPPTTVRGDAS
jgi:molybdopterin/thiamine biosynthesis adenylyltransferase